MVARHMFHCAGPQNDLYKSQFLQVNMRLQKKKGGGLVSDQDWLEGYLNRVATAKHLYSPRFFAVSDLPIV